MSRMNIPDGKGVVFTFDNGISLSIQIGGGSYSGNYSEPVLGLRLSTTYILPPSSTAELAVWDSRGDWAEIDGDMVKEYVLIEDAIRFAELLRSLPSGLDKGDVDLAIKAFDWRSKPTA